jgi:hypothetical protein
MTSELLTAKASLQPIFASGSLFQSFIGQQRVLRSGGTGE